MRENLGAGWCKSWAGLGRGAGKGTPAPCSDSAFSLLAASPGTSGLLLRWVLGGRGAQAVIGEAGWPGSSSVSCQTRTGHHLGSQATGRLLAPSSLPHSFATGASSEKRKLPLCVRERERVKPHKCTRWPMPPFDRLPQHREGGRKSRPCMFRSGTFARDLVSAGAPARPPVCPAARPPCAWGNGLPSPLARASVVELEEDRIFPHGVFMKSCYRRSCVWPAPLKAPLCTAGGGEAHRRNSSRKEGVSPAGGSGAKPRQKWLMLPVSS